MTEAESRSYAEIVTDTIKKRHRPFYILMSVLFSFFFFLSISLVYHIHIADVSFIAQAEQTQNRNLSEEMIVSVLYIHTTLYLAGAVLSLYSAIKAK